MNKENTQEIPAEARAVLDAYIERIKAIKWFKPSEDLKQEAVDTAVNAALSAFGIEAGIEYRNLKTPKDWEEAVTATWYAVQDASWIAAQYSARIVTWNVALNAAWNVSQDEAWNATWSAALNASRSAARNSSLDVAWNATRGVARGAADILAAHTSTYKLDTPFVKLIDIWEMGLYPVGVIDGKFVVYVPPPANFIK